MPNLWTKATQKFSEAFNGPRTKDSEFDKKVDEMLEVEKNFLKLRGVFNNFMKYTIGNKLI